MTFEVWTAFAIACAVLTLIPGPSVLLVIGQALTRGTSAALYCVLGDLLGNILLMVLSLLGVGAILATSATLFQIVKWAGVIYLFYLGYCQITEARKTMDGRVTEAHSELILNSFRTGFVTAALNPKAMMFYLAFLAQFIIPGASAALQIAILVLTSTIVTGIILTGYVLLAAKARSKFQSATAKRKIGYVGGGCLIGGSALIAATR